LVDRALQSPFFDIGIKEHIITFDDNLVTNEFDLENLIKNVYSNITTVFDENIKIHIKMKLNINEYLIISNVLFPTLMKIK
jgi:hypothetical protein